MSNTLQKYIRIFSKLKRGNTPFGIAPHKPVLLLTILQLLETGVISENRIYINADLVGTFKENWLLLVPTLHQADFTQPFYYLQNDQFKGEHFWFLKPNEGYSINNHIKSVKILAEVCDYAYLAEDLYLLLLDLQSNEILKQTLLTTYFPTIKDNYQKNTGDGYMVDMEDYVLNEPEVKMRKVAYTEEDVFVRN